jgi:transcription elongation factor Elf1
MDHPFYETVDKATELIEKGAKVWQKFTCAKCGSRQTMDQENTFYTLGTCEECGFQTDIEKQGCNYMLLWKNKR